MDNAVLEKGSYQAAEPTDLRSPCPVMNALANHGLIPRNGRSVKAAELDDALRELGIAWLLRAPLVKGTFLEHNETPPVDVTATLASPLAAIRQLGLRDANQTEDGVPVINLDQLSRHGALEHDGSMTRRDYAQGDNYSPQANLIAELIASSGDGEVITTEDFAAFRRARIAQQKVENPDFKLNAFERQILGGTVAFLQVVFGYAFSGYDLPVSYVRALFAEERLPMKEGWVKRQGWLAGDVAAVLPQMLRVNCAIGHV